MLIDEYQDTNGSQYRIVKALAVGHRNLCVVGDDDQSIYGWRGAEVAHILRFKRDWPDAKVVRLEDNYRSTAEILELANRLIAHNRTAARQGASRRPRREASRREFCNARTKRTRPSRWWTTSGRGSQRTGNRSRAISPSSFRTNEQCRAVRNGTAARRRAVHVLVGGMSFYDRKEVRDMLAYLKLLVDAGRRDRAAADHQQAGRAASGRRRSPR